MRLGWGGGGVLQFKSSRCTVMTPHRAIQLTTEIKDGFMRD